jgi:hypothetical protein
MFDGLLPALAEALERASTTTGPTTPRSAAPAALRETAAQLRVACLKLIKVTAVRCGWQFLRLLVDICLTLSALQ